jgi:hypothetical protein
MIALYVLAALFVGATFGFCWREIIAIGAPRSAAADS